MLRARLYSRPLTGLAPVFVSSGTAGAFRILRSSRCGVMDGAPVTHHEWTSEVPTAGFLAMRTARAPYATQQRGSNSESKTSVGEEAAETTSGLDFEYDPMASVQHDAAVETAMRHFDSVLDSLLPEGAPPSAAEKVRQYLKQHPVDDLITATNVQITHVENPESGAEEKVSLSPVPLQEALEQAQFRRMNLVQMGSRGDTAFCRIRHEKPWVYKLIAEEMKAVEAEQEAIRAQQESRDGGRRQHGGRGGGGMKPMTDHVFRDAVDAHFVGWKSKKICEDLKKGHPVKLTIREFQSAESALHKLREMSNAMRQYAEANSIYHYFTSVVGNEREASVTFSPATENKSGQVSKTVKHPGEKEWAHALRRMQDACQKSGRIGTYVKTGMLKPRNVGSTLYRTDKYGRRME